eukprot:Sdes_comp15696_c0_seq1m4724
MPLRWELEIHDIKMLVHQIKSVLPDWKNEEEILLTLRDNDYIVESAIESKFVEISHGGCFSTGNQESREWEELKKAKERLSELEIQNRKFSTENLQLREKIFEFQSGSKVSTSTSSQLL